MDIGSETARFCIAGVEAEFEGRGDDARGLYEQAWLVARDDYDRAIAAHYVGHALTHIDGDPVAALPWLRLALEAAYRDERATAFRASAHVALGGCYEALGMPEAAREFELAARLGIRHVRTEPGER